MKRVIWPIVVGLLSTLILIEAFTDLDFLDKDKVIHCEDVVFDTVTQMQFIKGDTITELVEVVEIDTFLREHFYLDTIYEVHFEQIRDTIMEYVDGGAKFHIDTVSFDNAVLTYGLLTEGGVYSFMPKLEVDCPRFKYRRWAAGVGYGFNGESVYLGSLRYRFLPRWDAQLLGGFGGEGLGVFVINHSF